MDLTSLSAKQLVELIATRTVSPVEVVNAYLTRIKEENPRLKAIATLAPDAIEKAQHAESAVVRGDRLGPLHGLPVTIKDTIATAGLLSTSGSRLRAEYVPTEDAPVVARLKAAGAIILAKSNTAEMAMEYTGDNPLFGRTNNPFDESLTPGGSSAGEAVAIATNMSPAGVGSDLAGSIRIPAHLCGITGLKPTTGRVPGEGQFPPSTGPYSLGAVIGPMARRVEDLEMLFNVLAGAKLDQDEQNLGGVGVAFYTDDNIAPVTSETRTAVHNAATALSNAGLRLKEIRPPGIERGYELWLKLFSRASLVQLRNIYSGNEDKGGKFVQWRLANADSAPIPTLDEFIQSWMERDRLRKELVHWMDDFPLLLAPVGSTNALKHDTLKINIDGTTLNVFKAFSYSQTFNTYDLPSVSVPAGTSADGLRIGVQVVGRPFAEGSVLAAARIIESALNSN
jgi:Asp-tRNA(Asn)/Glu-tRNA(Gln) amidotransferase A subunit family amidase